MLVRNTTQYMFASAVSAVFGFASAWVFTRLLTPHDYGFYILGVTIGSLISSLLFTWCRYSAMRFQAEGGDVDVRLTTAAAFVASAALAPLLVIGIGHFHGGSYLLAFGAVAYSLGISFFDIGQELLRARLQVRSFITGSIRRSVFAFGLCLIAAELGGGGPGQLAMAATAYFLASFVMSRAIWKGPRAPADFKLLRTFLRLGAPITLMGLLVACQASLDRWFIAGYIGDSAAGLYGASADIVRQIVLIPAGSVAAAAVPLAVRAFAESREASRGQLRQTFELLLAVLAPCSVGLAITSPYLAHFLLGPAFRETATQIMPILSVAWLFQAIAQSYVHVSFHLAKKPGLSVWQGAATVAVNAALLWPLTRAWGLAGAAAALVIAEALGLLAGVALTRFSEPLPSPLAAMARVGLACAGMAAAVFAARWLLPEPSAPAFFALAAIGAVVYVVAGVLLNVAGARTSIIAWVRARASADAGTAGRAA